ncbi:PRC-barrel domain-containing protein [Oceaniglobus ichthyenteri]|uniref:PRC-barrel domain-containing protein n=1 Tax=Oceaniglobus ichthyenteri TaxID=2136177 RepID=UPI000D3D0059|nr:PRC-barrel domain-containing protein [Oceaniglobus ichthyenteri]
MKRFLTTTAFATLFAVPALADSHTMNSPFFASEADVSQFEMRASTLIGKRLYTSENEMSPDGYMDVSDDWNDVGEISDILISREGKTEAVLLDIGGFLGLGERTVAVTIDQLQFVRDGDGEGDYWIVVKATEAQLDNAPEFDVDRVDAWTRSADGGAYQRRDAVATTETAPVVATDDTMKIDRMARDPINTDNMVAFDIGDLNTEDLTGAPVYDVNNEWIGEVSELLISNEGQVTEVIMDIGGFLGMGEHQVAMSMDQIQLMRDADDADEISVHVDAAGETLKDMPEYEAK